MQVWSAVEKYNAKEMRRNGESCQSIANKTGRTLKAVEEFFARERTRERDRRERRENHLLRLSIPVLVSSDVVRPSPDALAERNHRINLSPRDLTAAFFGDPLPGYSALDRR